MDENSSNPFKNDDIKDEEININESDESAAFVIPNRIG